MKLAKEISNTKAKKSKPKLTHACQSKAKETNHSSRIHKKQKTSHIGLHIITEDNLFS